MSGCGTVTGSGVLAEVRLRLEGPLAPASGLALRDVVVRGVVGSDSLAAPAPRPIDIGLKGDLDGNGLDMVSRSNSTALFDMDGDAFSVGVGAGYAFFGTPEAVAECPESHTGHYLAPYFESDRLTRKSA